MNRIGSFQGRYVSLETTFFSHDKKYGSVSIEVLEVLSPESMEDVFRIPEDASRGALILHMSRAITGAHRLSGESPRYPQEAKAEGLHGLVDLQADIGTDGSVGNLEVISGPKLLVDASLAAAKTWKYSPGPAQWETCNHKNRAS